MTDLIKTEKMNLASQLKTPEDRLNSDLPYVILAFDRPTLVPKAPFDAGDDPIKLTQSALSLSFGHACTGPTEEFQNTGARYQVRNRAGEVISDIYVTKEGNDRLSDFVKNIIDGKQKAEFRSWADDVHNQNRNWCRTSDVVLEGDIRHAVKTFLNPHITTGKYTFNAAEVDHFLRVNEQFGHIFPAPEDHSFNESIEIEITSASTQWLGKYDLFQEDSIWDEIKKINIERESDVLGWGKKIEELCATDILSCKAVIMADKKRAAQAIREATIAVQNDLYENHIVSNRSSVLTNLFDMLAGLAGGSPEARKMRRKPFVFEQIVSSIQSLAGAANKDSDACLEIMKMAEQAEEEISKYGPAIRLHRDALKEIYKEYLAKSESEETQEELDPILARKPQDIRQRLKDRINSLDVSYKTWENAVLTFRFIASGSQKEMEEMSSLGKRIQSTLSSQIDVAFEIEQQKREMEIQALSGAIDQVRYDRLSEQLRQTVETVSSELSALEKLVQNIDREVELLSDDDSDPRLLEQKEVLQIPVFDEELELVSV